MTPFEVSFLDAAESPWEPLFLVNRCVDLVFIVDIVFSFLLVYQEAGGVEGTRWVEDQGRIVRHYLKGWFALDVISVLPFDFASIGGGSAAAARRKRGGPAAWPAPRPRLAAAPPKRAEGRGMASALTPAWWPRVTRRSPPTSRRLPPAPPAQSGDVSKLKILRVIRLARLVKLVRLVRGARMFKRWEARLAINYSTLTLTLCLLGVLVSSHWFACIWALQTTLLYDDPSEGWMGKDGYCVSTYNETASLLHGTEMYDTELEYACVDAGTRYSVSIYFAVMTITSIGYGDVAATPKHPTEQAMATFLMLIGSMLWAYIIATFCGMIAMMNPTGAAFRNTIDDLNRFMELQALEPEMKRRLREYFHQTKHLQIAQANRKLLAKMSPALAGEVAVKTSERWLKRVWFLASVDGGFMAQLAMNIDAMVFAPAELAPVGKLYICHRGVALYGGRLLTAGRVWGEDMILESVHLIKPYSARAMNYLECYMISKDDLLKVAAGFPGTLRHIRQCAIRLALTREIIRIAREKRIEEGIEEPSSGVSVLQRSSSSSMFGASLDASSKNVVLAPGRSDLAAGAIGKRMSQAAAVQQRAKSGATPMWEALAASQAKSTADQWSRAPSGGLDRHHGSHSSGGSSGGGGGGGGVEERVEMLAAEVASLRGSIEGIEQLLRAALPQLAGASAKQPSAKQLPRAGASSEHSAPATSAAGALAPLEA